MSAAADTLTSQHAVLGSILISPEVTGMVLSELKPDDFTDSRCRIIFTAIQALFTAGATVDPVTVMERLSASQEQTTGQWRQFLLDLMEITPTAANVMEYVGIVRAQARMTRIRSAAYQLYGAQTPEEAAALIQRLNEMLAEREAVRRMNMERMLVNFYERHSRPHDYVTWGLYKLDGRLCTELGDMVVLGGSPSTGKTALAVSFAWHMARTYRVGFYSLETNQYKLADRLVASLAEIDLQTIKHGTIDEDGWARLSEQADSIKQRQLEIIEASGMTIQDIKADVFAHRYQVVFIDYLQIIEPDSRRENRTNQVGQISRDIQQMCHRHGILTVALSQLSRSDEDKEPVMSDLRESGQIEQDADIIMLLYLDEPHRADKSLRTLKVAKNKDGERGRISLVFDGAHQTFRASRVDPPEPVPKPKRRKPAQTSMWDSYRMDDGPPDDDPFPQKTE